ncbi:DUF190 domain-containing protein [Streptomyces sp. NPDC058385]|uniref:DUF190 domain-containing protein n=1 Tax=Streptomyces sp. NPDC058385 TaxID=3346473 RepID=UPI003665440D
MSDVREGAAMLEPGPAARLTIHLSGTALWHHKPVYAEIVHRAHRAGLSGASVFHGIHGYEVHLHARREWMARVSAQGPCAVVIIDHEQRLRDFLAQIEEVLDVTGIACLDHVEVYRPT